MAGTGAIEVEGAIVEALPNRVFRVALANGHRVLAHQGRQGRSNPISLAAGDKVILEMSPFDLSKGRIVAGKKQI